MNLREIEAQAKALAPVIKRFVLKLLEPLALQIKMLESRQPEKGEPGPAGKDVDPEQVEQICIDLFHANSKELAKAVLEGLPIPKDGIDGKSVSAEDVLPTLQAQLKEMVAALPAPKDGIDGKSVSIEDVQQQLTTLHDSGFAKWALEFERRAADIMERAIGRLPKPADGKDGRDGFGFEDIAVEHDGIGGVTVRFVRGEHTKEFNLRLPVFIDRGVYREDVKDYMQGNGVTFGGSFYIAQKDAPDGKPGLSADWRLAVKKGRDGRGAQ